MIAREYEQKVFEAKIVGASEQSWYKDQIGNNIKVVKFTHNYYRDAYRNDHIYHVSDVKLGEEQK